MEDDVRERPNAPAPGHKPNGQFAPGNRWAKGNPNARRMFELRKTFLDAIDPEAVAMAATRLCMMAQLGDLDAIKILFDYAIGKPPASLELSGPDGSPLDVNIAQVRAVIVEALKPYPEARVKIAAALMELSRANESGDAGERD